MKSTTSFRPAIPPPPALLLMYAAAPSTPSTTPWKMPGATGLSTSASTATWISVALTPISVGRGASSIEWAIAGKTARAVNAVNIAGARNTFADPSLILQRIPSRRGGSSLVGTVRTAGRRCSGRRPAGGRMSVARATIP